MKFGKLLRQSLNDSYFTASLDYKTLKKICKRLRESKRQQPCDSVSSDSDCFPQMLTTQQRAIERFYFLKEEELYAALEKIQSKVYWLAYQRALCLRKSDEDLKRQAIRQAFESFLAVATSLTFLAREADVLVQYVDMNKEAFRKILKKYDKCTGQCTIGLLEEIRDLNPFLDGKRARQLKSSVMGVIEHLDSLRSCFNFHQNRLVLAVGIFDDFHVGHENLLLSMQELGNQVAIGVYSDQAAQSMYGYFPNQCFESRVQRLSEWGDVHLFEVDSPDPTNAILEVLSEYCADHTCFVSGSDHEEFPSQFHLDELMPVHLVPSKPSLFRIDTR